MSLIDVNWSPSQRQLRQFAAVCLVALPLLGWIWGATSELIAGLAVAGILLAAVGMVFPRGIKPLFLALTIVTVPIGMVVSELAMLGIYFGVIMPIGLLFRLARRDALQLKIDREADSYWQARKPPRDAASYFRQF